MSNLINDFVSEFAEKAKDNKRSIIEIAVFIAVVSCAIFFYEELGLTFPIVLVFLTFIAGITWMLDSLVFAKLRKQNAIRSMPAGVSEQIQRESDSNIEKIDYRSNHWFIDSCRSLFTVIFVVLILRSFVAEPFQIPSESMLPTLENGDFILVNKFTYGIRLPAIDTKIIEVGQPERGDVVVFKYPQNPKVDYIKRVVALPGDRISLINNVIHINGKAMKQIVYGPVGVTGKGETVIEFEEDLDGAKHMGYHVKGRGYPVNYWRPSELFGNGILVPEGHYFVMGDNRDNSQDSRFWGFVPEENLRGKAFFIWFNWGEWSRIGNSIE